MKTKHLRKQDYGAVVAARRALRAEREHAASSFRQSLVDQLRATRGASEESFDAATVALLDSVTSVYLEIQKTSDQMIRGVARPASVKSLGFARSELRRSLRALGLLANDGEAPAPPAGPTLEELKARYEPREVAS